MMRLRVVGLMVLLTCASARAQADQPAPLPRQALDAVRQIAIQHNGRTKPFDSFAREALQSVTGAPRVGSEDPVATVLSILANPDHWQDVPLISVPFIPLREALGMDRRASRVSYNELLATRKLMRMLPAIAQKQQREEKLSMVEQETMDAFDRFATLSGLFEHRLTVVPPPPGSDRIWQPVLQPAGYAASQQDAIRTAWTALISAARAGSGQAAADAAGRFSETMRGLNPSAYPPQWRIALEVWYNHVQPFHVARLLYLLAVLGLLVGLNDARARWAGIGLGLCWAAFVVHGAGILLRVVLGGRPPVSNFFETTLWLPFVGVVIALIFESLTRTRYLALAASLLAAITLVVADYLPLDSSISPVVAVLHSNLWLTIHVLTIVASYGALGLATVLAHVYGWRYLQRAPAHPALPSLDRLLYRVIQVGVVLLAAGIMLGAVWANASWGRYWGWDPKETWALITLLWFLAVLHGRFAGWIQGVGVALSTIGGFFLLLMTYYGVSFYLVGLHSYAGGHAKPLPLLLIAYLLAEVAFLLVVGVTAARRRRPV